MDTPVLAVRHVSKSFAGVRALVDIDLEIAPGEIHCLAGENGSGKSTLIKVISGVHTPEEGSVAIAGREYAHLTPSAAIDAGVRVIYQDFSVFPNLSVMENIALGSEVAAGRALVNRSRMRKVAAEAIAKIGFQVDLDELVGNLSVADKQLVAISRALMGDAKLIIMDEPTTALTKKEVRALFDIVADLQSRGIAILFVSHKLEEVFEIAQRFTILRSGRKVITCPKEELDRASFARHMTGRDFDEAPYRTGYIDADPVLEVREATVADAFENASLSVRPGEILGITGLLGSGRTELALSLFGMLPLDSGTVSVAGKDVTLRGVRDAIKAGIAYVPEDRLTEGLFLSRSIGDNITISEMESFTKALGFIDKEAIRAEEKRWVERLGILTPDPDNAVNTLSGGNQQKVVLAKWLATNPSVLILNGPTVGVDIGSKFTIHSILRELAAQGMAIIIISDDIAEVLTNCSTIAIMRAGHLSEPISPDTLTEAELTRLLSEEGAPASSTEGGEN
ncbi:MAG: sugar ABC transporter ATP-binding protein [Schaalia sp.]